MYYINDGVYGSFNCLLYDHATVEAEILEGEERGEEATFMSSVWGPTCDGLDCVLPEVELPDLEIGAWLFFRNMGAYTLAAGSTFNGMPRPQVHHWCNGRMAIAEVIGNTEDKEEERKEVKMAKRDCDYEGSSGPSTYVDYISFTL